MQVEESEHLQQARFVAWFRKNYPEHWIWANPNAGLRTPSQGARMKAEGMLTGVPDLHVPSLNLWIEFKTSKGKLSQAQKEVIAYLRSPMCGHTVLIVYGFEDAKEQVLKEMEDFL